MKAIQNKILILIASSILISTIAVIAIAFFSHNRFVENDSKHIMQLTCTEKRRNIDEKLMNIEQSVHTLYHYAMEQLPDSLSQWEDDLWVSDYIDKISLLMETSAKYTDGAVTVFYRISPDFQGPKGGVWLVMGEDGEFISHETTDLSQYDKSDIEHVGWYYIPVENREETWMQPYYNQNLGMEIISYVIPMIQDGVVVGVVGMDITTDLLYENAKAVTIYDSGYAFLMDEDGAFVYHPEMEEGDSLDNFDEDHVYLFETSLVSVENHSVEGYQWNYVDKRLTTQKLSNGMLFTVCVPEFEIKKEQTEMLIRSMVTMFLVVSIFILIGSSLAKVIVGLAYTDVLTGLNNKTAYKEAVDVIYKKQRGGEKVAYTVAVIDINDLKKANDTYGHETGDLLIQKGANLLAEVWGHENSYRIGGDEFVALVMKSDEEFIREKQRKFEEELVSLKELEGGKEPVLQMAMGVMIHPASSNEEYIEVFRKADNAMYEDKKAKKTCVPTVS